MNYSEADIIHIDPIENIFDSAWIDLTDGNDIPFLNKFEIEQPTKYGTSANRWSLRCEEKYTREQNKNGCFAMAQDNNINDLSFDYDELNMKRMQQPHPQFTENQYKQKFPISQPTNNNSLMRNPYLEDVGCGQRRIPSGCVQRRIPSDCEPTIITDRNCQGSVGGYPNYLPNRYYSECGRLKSYYDRDYPIQPFVFPSEPVGVWSTTNPQIHKYDYHMPLNQSRPRNYNSYLEPPTKTNNNSNHQHSKFDWRKGESDYDFSYPEERPVFSFENMSYVLIGVALVIAFDVFLKILSPNNNKI